MLLQTLAVSLVFVYILFSYFISFLDRKNPTVIRIQF